MKRKSIHKRESELNRREFCQAAVAGGIALGAQAEQQPARIPSPFESPTDDCKMILYYWWFGPSQTESQVSLELEAMRRAGIGGIFIFPVYPLSADDAENYPYLSGKFLRVLRFTVERARQLSISVDLLVGGGWPFGGPTIKLEKSSRTIRRVPKSTPLQEGEELIAIEERSSAAFISTPTKQRIKGAVIGTEGWVLDHLSRSEVNTYLENVPDKLISGLPRGTLRSINFDSLEGFGQHWTPDFPEEFRKRRSYDLIPHLTALWEDVGEDTPHIRYDYWRTLADLFLDNFLRPFHEWSRKHGVALQGKPMGTPINDLRAFSEVELAVAEEYDWLEFSGPRWAASGAHLYGQNLVGNEGYTWLRSPRYMATLQDLKVGSDVQFLAGVNVIIGHGFSYSPESTGVPGWSFYASVYFHPKNPWWPYLPHLAKYVQRVSFILRQGVPIADIALLLPEDDVMANAAAGQLNRAQKVIVKARLAKPGDTLPQFGIQTALKNRSPLVSTMVTNGYSFDGMNNEALQNARIEGKHMAVGLGRYSVLVLPSITGMPVESMEKIQQFLKAGGTVIAIGQAPSLSYGLLGWRERSSRVKEIAAQIFAPGKGAYIVADEDSSLLNALRVGCPPDIDFAAADPEVGFIHRKTATHDFYFLANTSAEPKRLQATFRIGRRQPEIWNPRTGSTRVLSEYRYTKGGTACEITLEPYESTIVVFSSSTKTPLRTRRAPAAGKLPPTLSIPGPWQLEIEGRSVSIGELRSWTDREEFRYFSGTGVYRTVFDWQPPQTSNNLTLWLSLGRIHEIADVELNGAAAGVAWMEPYRLEVTARLKPGKNQLVIKVTNLLINRVLGQPAPDVSALVEKFSKRFSQIGERPDLKFAQNMEKSAIANPLPSGLLGPVEIRATHHEPHI